MNYYEQKLAINETQASTYNQWYSRTYDYHWLTMNQPNLENINLIQYRQSLIERICHVNNLIEDYKSKLSKQEEVNSFLQKIYFFINLKLIKYENDFYDARTLL